MDLEAIQEQLHDIADVEFAVRQLIEDGVATRLSGRIGVTRTAWRVQQLAPI